MTARGLRLASLLLGTAVLAGCATFSDDGGFGAVEQATAKRLDKQVRWMRSDDDRKAGAERVQQLLAEPLTADSAVQVALLNNRGLQAEFAELGITEAEVVQAGRLPNPGFSYARLTRGSEIERERTIGFDLARLVALPWINRMEARRFQLKQGEVSLAVLGLASDTRKAWLRAVAADETVRYMQQVQRTAAASSELARRMAAVGNFSKLQRAREQAFDAEAQLMLARALQNQVATRERLTRLLGLWGQQADFKLPERLPDLPQTIAERPDIERTAMAQRLDIQGARLTAEQTARNLGLTKVTRFIDVLEVSYQSNLSNEAPTQRGWEIGVELPLFDWGGAKVARAEAVYVQAVEQAAQTAIDARSEVREAYAAWRIGWDIARHHREQLVPLRNLIAEENVLRYNGMLIGVFELLADARLQILAVNSAIDALRDFWIADADLEMSLIGKPSMAAAAGAAGAMAPGAGNPGGAEH
ncbi:MAG: TolC family protein [Rubrivivax sp.]